MIPYLSSAVFYISFTKVAFNIREMEMKGLSSIMTVNISIGLEVTSKQSRYGSMDISEHESRYQVNFDIKERDDSKLSE